MNAEDIFIDTKFLHSVAKIYGFISSKIITDKRGRKYLEYQKRHYCISIIFQLITCVCGYFVVCDYCKHSYKITNGGLFFILDIIAQVGVGIAGLAYCVWNKIYNKDNQKFWQELYETEKKVTSLDICLNHKLLRIVTSSCVVCTVATAYLSNLFFAIFNQRDVKGALYLANSVYYHYNCMSYGMAICQSISSFTIVGHMLEILEETTKKKFLISDPNQRAIELLEIAKCHQEICNMARKANRMVSVQLLFLFMEMFCILTVSTFKSTASILYNVYGIEDILMIAWAAVSLAVITILITVSHNCTEKVNEIIKIAQSTQIATC